MPISFISAEPVSYTHLDVYKRQLGNCACYLFVAIQAFLGAYGVGSVVQYVSVLTRLGDGIRDLMFMVSDNRCV